jgi:hypothetical protein
MSEKSLLQASRMLSIGKQWIKYETLVCSDTEKLSLRKLIWTIALFKSSKESIATFIATKRKKT